MNFCILWVEAIDRSMNGDAWSFDTRAIHSGYTPDSDTGATNVPIYQSAGFAHDPDTLEAIFNGRQPGFYYSRTGNPTVAALEQRLTALELGRGAVCVSSGMAAIMTVFCTLAQSGDNVVVAKSLFGSTYYLFHGVIASMGIDVRFVDSTDVSGYAAALDARTRFVFLEAIGNPKLDVPDVRAIADVAHAHGIPLVVDTTFVTPYLAQSRSLGIDIVTVATTKYLCGGGLAIGGAVIDTGLFQWPDYISNSPDILKTAVGKLGELGGVAAFKKVRGTTGNSLAAQNAFLTLKGVETLSLRMDRHCSNAMAVATYLYQHPAVTVTQYPGLSTHAGHAVATRQFGGRYGGMVTLRLGSKARAYAFLNALTVIQCLVNLGDAKTLAVCPRRTIYRDLTDEQAAEAGVYDDLIRLSVGLESEADLIADLTQALEVL